LGAEPAPVSQRDATVRGVRRVIGIALALILALPAVASAVGPRGPLGHHGRWITDARGRAVILHGVNMVYKVPPYYPKAAGFGRNDARFLARHGFNTVRLGLIYAGVEPQPGRIDARYLRRIGKTEHVLAKHRIFSLLDFHQDLYNEKFQGEGFPNWAVQDDGLPATPKQGFPANYFVMPALQRAYDHFWANDPGPDDGGLQDHYAAAWSRVAKHFRSAPYVLGYDLFNEPFPGTPWLACANPVGCPTLDASLLGAFSKRVIHRIRQVDPRTLAFYEPWVTFDFGAQTAHPDTGDAHAAMSFHDYCLPAGLGAGTLPAQGTGCGTEENLAFDNADAQSARTGDALLLTEFGATDNLDTLRRIADLADQHMVGWQEWHYCACGEPTSQVSADIQALVKDPAKPPRGKNVKHRKLRVLERPYPQAVAGTPASYSFDPGADLFRLEYSTKGLAGKRLARRVKTVVYVPRIHYRHGYSVKVKGARVVSRPGARHLVLQRGKRAQAVSVSVRPPA
jgi:endoglycosylceramidase